MTRGAWSYATTVAMCLCDHLDRAQAVLAATSRFVAELGEIADRADAGRSVATVRTVGELAERLEETESKVEDLMTLVRVFATPERGGRGGHLAAVPPPAEGETGGDPA